MTRKPRNIPCSHTTRAGRPCRAWAAEGTDPPACSAHAGRNVGAGARPGNQNARTHGFYSRLLSEQERAGHVIGAAGLSLDDQIACVRLALRRAREFVPGDPGPLDRDTFLRALGLIFHSACSIAYILRHRQALAATDGDPFQNIIDQALDEPGKERGTDL